MGEELQRIAVLPSIQIDERNPTCHCVRPQCLARVANLLGLYLRWT